MERADLAESKGAEVHVYAHPSKVVTNLQHPKEKVCVVKCVIYKLNGFKVSGNCGAALVGE